MQAKSSKRFIDLTEILIVLNTAIYQLHTQNESAKFISLAEKLILCDLRRMFAGFGDSTSATLRLSGSYELDQDGIIEEHVNSLKIAYADSIKFLQQSLEVIGDHLTQPHSQEFIACLTDIQKLLQSSLELIEKIKITSILAKEPFTKNNVYQLCRLLGVLYIPVSQALDPLLGGDEEEGKIDLSGGNCGGKVRCWIEACAKTSELSYPFYAQKYERIYQENQEQVCKNNTFKLHDTDLFKFTEQVCTELKPNRLYEFSIGNDSSGHAIGLRLRQDNVYELFDPNFFHLFTSQVDLFAIILQCLLVEYQIAFGYNRFTLIDSNVLQCDTSQIFFPHVNQIILGEHKINTDKQEAQFCHVLVVYYNKLKDNYKKGKISHDQAQDVFLKTLSSFTSFINHEDTIKLILTGVNKIKISESFVQTEENHSQLTKILQERLSHIQTTEHQQEYHDKTIALKTTQAVLGEIGKEVNALKQQIFSATAAKQRSPIIGQLINQSTSLWQMLRKLSVSNKQLTISMKKKSPFSGKFFLQQLLQDVFNYQTPNTDILTLQNNVTQVAQTSLQASHQQISTVENTPRIALIAVIEKFISACHSLEQSDYANVILSLQKTNNPRNKLVLQQFKPKLAALKKELTRLFNDCSLAVNDSILYERFNQLLDLNSETITTLSSYEVMQLRLMVIEKITDSVSLLKQQNVVANNVIDPHELTTLKASLFTIINYLGIVREECQKRLETHEKTRTAMNIFIARKLQSIIQRQEDVIKDLLRQQNALVTLDQTDDAHKFIQIASHIRQCFPTLFPIDFTLSDDFANLLDTRLERYKVIILNPAELQKVQQLANCLALLRDGVQQILHHLQHFNHPEKLERALTDYANEFLRYCTSKNPDEIFEYVYALGDELNIEDNRIDLGDYTNRCYLQIEGLPQQIQEKLKNLIDYIYRFGDNQAVAILELAKPEYNSGNILVPKDYTLMHAKKLNEIVMPLESKYPFAELTKLKQSFITLHHLLTGRVGFYTEGLWQELSLASANNQEQQTHRQKIAAIAYHYYLYYLRTHTLTSSNKDHLLVEHESIRP